MLLAVAEYSEGLEASRAPNEQPFVIHKVFYREAVAGMLHHKHPVLDKDIALLQNILRQCIPNPENFKSKLLEQFNGTISKVSIIQHGQEYHYTNIKMAFIEVSKIINQVCSPTNLNARSILVEIPSVLPYSILDKNRYLAYLHEKQKREREEERRRMELHLRYQRSHTESHTTQTNQTNRYYNHYEDKFTEQNQHSLLNQHHSISTQASLADDYYGRNTVDQACQTPVDLGVSSRAIDLNNFPGVQYKGRFVKFPIETSIRTKEGKKIVTYHDTGESYIYGDPLDYQSQSWMSTAQNGFSHSSNLSSSAHFTKSTPNLAKDSNSASSRLDRSFGSEEDVSYGERREIPQESYLRKRSQSMGDMRFKDKIDRYPALLIEPGRKSIRGYDFSEGNKNKWRIKSPKFWSGSDSLTKANIRNNAAQSSTNSENLASTNKSVYNVPRPSSAVNTHNRTNIPLIQVQYSSTGPAMSNPADHSSQGRRLSLVSNFSDISVSSRLQQDADNQFKHFYNSQHLDHQTPNDQTRGRIPSPQPYRQEPLPSTSQASATRAVPSKHGPLHPSYFSAAAEFLKQSGDYYSDDSSINSGSRMRLSTKKVVQGDDSDASSLLLDHTPSATPDPSVGGRTHTVDRDFVYRAYPVTVREA